MLQHKLFLQYFHCRLHDNLSNVCTLRIIFVSTNSQALIYHLKCYHNNLVLQFNLADILLNGNIFSLLIYTK